jgi:hypothetical protein
MRAVLKKQKNNPTGSIIIIGNRDIPAKKGFMGEKNGSLYFREGSTGKASICWRQQPTFFVAGKWD